MYDSDGPMTERRVGEIPNQINRLSELCDVLDKSVEDLAVRLVPIMTSADDQSSEKLARESKGTEIGEALCRHSEKIERIIVRINSLQDRLEI